jgi:8-amino-7-oxononanoate synthase
VDLFDKCKKFTRAKEVIAAGMYPYFRPIQSGPGSEVIIDGRSMIMIGSNNYLGLTGHPKVVEAAKNAIEKYGTGCTGSRYLNGTLDIHVELELRLARFMKRDKVICFTTGHQSNQGALSAIIGKNDIVFTDRADHASIVDGCRLSFGKIKKYRHNDMEDLERALSS